MGVTVEIDNLSNIEYSEYFLTGFNILKEKKIINDFRVKFKRGINPGPFCRYKHLLKDSLKFKFNQYFQAYCEPIENRGYLVSNMTLAEKLIKSSKKYISTNKSPDWGIIHGKIIDGSKKINFAINIWDTPWNFEPNYFLNESDLYFKCQYPKDFKKGIFRITGRETIALSNEVLENSFKIRPFMIGRPLSRELDFKKNKKILTKFEEKRSNKLRDNKLLIYLGMPIDNIDIPNTHHPHIKRAKIVSWAKNNLVGAKIIYKPSNQERILKELTDEEKVPINNRTISDREYRNLILNSLSTLNVTGLRGCLSWRSIDSFLSSTLLISDNLSVDWYEPLIPGKDFLSIGDLGYELMEDIDFNSSLAKLHYYIENIDDLYRVLSDYREQRFIQFYSPEASAKYILEEAEVI